jgi:hypothetical protein
LTSRRGGSRLALFVRLASPRRVLDDRVVFADSGSSPDMAMLLDAVPQPM